MNRIQHLSRWQQDVFTVAISLGFGILLYGIGLYPLYGGSGMTYGWLRIVLFAAICVVELFRRRAPVVAFFLGFALLLADGFLGVSVPMWVVFADLLYAVTLYGPWRLSRMMISVAVLSAGGVVVTALVFTPDWRSILVAGLATLPVVVIPVAWATNIRQHQEIAEAERTNAAQLARISELDRTAAVAAERARMARDLHDVVSGHLSAIAIQSEAALSMDDEIPNTARTVLTSVRENSVRALDEMRAMIGVLRADRADEATAPARLAELSQLVESARTGGMSVEVYSEVDEAAPLPAAVDLTAYRIAQESLTNAMKHAPRTEVRVDIRRGDDVLTVDVANELADDPGSTDDTGTGLLNMRERAVAVGGSFTAGPTESGWRVRAVLPVSGEGS